MQNARLIDGSIINANEYIRNLHEGKILCPYCDAPVIYVMPQEKDPYFKTTGKNNSIHDKYCSERRELAVFDSIRQIKRYTAKIDDLTDYKEYIFNLNLENIHIDEEHRGKVNEIGFNHPKKKLKYTNRYGNTKNALRNIRTLDLLAKIIRKNYKELNKIVFDYNGCKYLLEDIIIDQNKAFELASTGQIKDIDYVVYGKVRSLISRETVKYINLEEQDGMVPFTGVIFKDHFPDFTYDERINGKPVLIAGKLLLNKMYNKAQIIIKSDLQVSPI